MTQTTLTQPCSSACESKEPDTREAATSRTHKATVWTRIVVVLRRWQRNRAAWRHLSRLPDELLDDVGLTRSQARAHLDRPLKSYWR